VIRNGVYFALVIGCTATVASGQPDSALSSGSWLGLGAGMGVSLVSVTDVADYINERSFQYGRQDDFTVAIEFYCAPQFRIGEEIGLKLEFAYLLRSYNIPQSSAPDVIFSFGVLMPTAIVQYLIIEHGYTVKFGGGAGYHVATFTEEYVPGEQRYTSSGIGLKLEAESNVSFDDHLSGAVVIDMRDDIAGEFKAADGSKLHILNKDKDASMNFFSLGLKFGLMYYF
jgi:hypothetical protein